MLLPFTIILILWKWPLPQWRWQRPFYFHRPYFLIGDKTGNRQTRMMRATRWQYSPTGGPNQFPPMSSVMFIMSFIMSKPIPPPPYCCILWPSTRNLVYLLFLLLLGGFLLSQLCEFLVCVVFIPGCRVSDLPEISASPTIRLSTRSTSST